MDSILTNLLEGFPNVEGGTEEGVVHLPPADIEGFATAAHDAGFEVCVDVTAVDWLDTRQPRFDLVYNLVSVQHRERLRILVGLDGDEPTVASVTPIWPGANFAEREVYDMFGINFERHPDLTRILMPDDWEGYPLRKDFAVGSVPVQFKAAHQVN